MTSYPCVGIFFTSLWLVVGVCAPKSFRILSKLFLDDQNSFYGILRNNRITEFEGTLEAKLEILYHFRQKVVQHLEENVLGSICFLLLFCSVFGFV